MNIIIDANIILATILNEPEKEKIINATKQIDLVSPEILPYEIGNALSSMYKKRRLTKIEIDECFQIFTKIPIRLINIQIAEAIRIAYENNIYAYDAYYLEAAKRLGIRIFSLDSKMIEIARKINISVMEVV